MVRQKTTLSAVRVVSLMFSTERRDNEPLNLQVWDVICFWKGGGGSNGVGHRQIQPSAVAIQGVTQHSIRSHFGGVTQNSEVPSVPWPLMVSQHRAVKSPVRFMPTPTLEIAGRLIWKDAMQSAFHFTDLLLSLFVLMFSEVCLVVTSCLYQL